MGFEFFKRKKVEDTPAQREMDKKDRIAGVATLGLIGALGADIALTPKLPDLEHKNSEQVQYLTPEEMKKLNKKIEAPRAVDEAVVSINLEQPVTNIDLSQKVVHMKPPEGSPPK